MTHFINRAPVDDLGRLMVTGITPTPDWPSIGGMTYHPTTGELAVINSVPTSIDPYNGGIRFTNLGAMYVTSTLPSPVFYVGGIVVSADGRVYFSSSPPVGAVGGWPIAGDGGISGIGFDTVPIFAASLMTTLVPEVAGNPTFTFDRNCYAYLQDFEGLLRATQVNNFREARFRGARRVQNMWGSQNTTMFSLNSPPIGLSVVDYDGRAKATKIDWPTGSAGWQVEGFNGPGPRFTSVLGATYRISMYLALSRPLTGAERITVTIIGAADIPCLELNASIQPGTAFARMTGSLIVATPAVSGIMGLCFRVAPGAALTSPLTQYAWGFQAEDVSGQTNQAPSELVSYGALTVPWHGNNIDGVKYFNTTNGNSINGNFVVEAPGVAIPASSMLGYIAENVATNICAYSQEFDSTAWLKGNTTVPFINTQMAPDGTMTADTIADNAVSGGHQITRSGIPSVASTVYTCSVYAKQGTLPWMQLFAYPAVGNVSVWVNVNLATGAMGFKSATGTAEITALPNGWFRVSVSFPALTNNFDTNIYCSNSNFNGQAPQYVGTGQTMYLWGAQVETGDGATSYIPTTTGTASRNADMLSYQAVGNISGALGTAYSEDSMSLPGAGAQQIAIHIGTGYPQYYEVSKTLSIFSGPVLQSANTRILGTVNKAATAWGGTTASVCLNSGAVAAGAYTPLTATGLAIGHSGNGVQTISGAIRNVKIYNTRLTDPQLQALTSPPPAIFDLPLLTSLLPTFAVGNRVPTQFSRGLPAFVADHEGILRPAYFNETRFHGARRVRNQAGFSESFTATAGVTLTTGFAGPTGALNATRAVYVASSGGRVQGGDDGPTFTTDFFAQSIWLRGEVGGEQVTLWNGWGSQPVFTLTNTWKRYAVMGLTGTGSNGMFLQSTTGAAITVYVTGFQVELTTGAANQAPGEYVSKGVLSAPYHGNWIDGVKYFATTNGNSVVGNVVTEAPGVPIPAATMLGYVAENVSTNVCYASQAFSDNTRWTPVNIGLTIDTQVAPDGTLTADVMADNAVNGNHMIAQALGNLTAGVPYTFSIYMKRGTLPWMQVMFAHSISDWANFNLISGTVGNKSAGVSAYMVALPNGWYRCVMTFTVGTVGNQFQILTSLTDSPTIQPSYVGTGQTVYLWGAQLEQAVDVSSYIPTAGATVSRNMDFLNFDFAGNIDGATGSLYAESYLPVNNATMQTVMAVTNFHLQYYEPPRLVTQSGVAGSASTNNRVLGSVNKSASAWSGATMSAYLNNGPLATAAFANFGPQTGLYPAGPPVNTRILQGALRNVKIYNVRISDVLLQGMTQ